MITNDKRVRFEVDFSSGGGRGDEPFTGKIFGSTAPFSGHDKPNGEADENRPGDPVEQPPNAGASSLQPLTQVTTEERYRAVDDEPDDHEHRSAPR